MEGRKCPFEIGLQQCYKFICCAVFNHAQHAKCSIAQIAIPLPFACQKKTNIN